MAEDWAVELEQAREGLRAYYATLGLTASVTGGEVVINNSHGMTPWRHFAWTVRFTVNSTSEAFQYRMGMGHVGPDGKGIHPDPAEVLADVCRDAQAMGQSFDDWASEFGYDVTRADHVRTFNECVKAGRMLLRLGLTRNQINAMAEMGGAL